MDKNHEIERLRKAIFTYGRKDGLTKEQTKMVEDWMSTVEPVDTDKPSNRFFLAPGSANGEPLLIWLSIGDGKTTIGFDDIDSIELDEEV